MKIVNNFKSAILNLINHRHFQKYEKYVSLILWMLAIYYLSNQSLGFLGGFDLYTFIIRKIAHMFEYAVLTFLIFRILHQTEERHIYWDIFWSFVFTLLYAISDEYHQTFIYGRVGTYRDVLIDSLGIIVAVWFILLDYHHRRIMESRNIIKKITKILKKTE
ncbi:MAG: VanZ family protein [Candidatus Parcubacteria bacterium]|nr:VanZ family protein [Candidatus Parcubacteria bacterium]